MADALVANFERKVQYLREAGGPSTSVPLSVWPSSSFPLSEPQFPRVCSEGVA